MNSMQKVLDLLFSLWVYDIEVLSTGWVHWLVVPAMFYASFMIVKWTFLTIPVWITVLLISGVIRAINFDEREPSS